MYHDDVIIKKFLAWCEAGYTEDALAYLKACIRANMDISAAPPNNAVHLTSAANALNATDDTEPQAQVTADR